MRNAPVSSVDDLATRLDLNVFGLTRFVVRLIWRTCGLSSYSSVSGGCGGFNLFDIVPEKQWEEYGKDPVGYANTTPEADRAHYQVDARWLRGDARR